MSYNNGLFTTLCEDDFIVSGIYDSSESWNGWYMPYFDFDNAQIILNFQGNKEEYKKDNFETSFYEISDIPKGIIHYHEDGIEFYKAIQFEGKDYYSIGRGCWTWCLIPEEEEEG